MLLLLRGLYMTDILLFGLFIIITVASSGLGLMIAVLLINLAYRLFK